MPAAGRRDNKKPASAGETGLRWTGIASAATGSLAQSGALNCLTTPNRSALSRVPLCQSSTTSPKDHPIAPGLDLDYFRDVLRVHCEASIRIASM